MVSSELISSAKLVIKTKVPPDGGEEQPALVTVTVYIPETVAVSTGLIAPGIATPFKYH